MSAQRLSASAAVAGREPGSLGSIGCHPTTTADRRRSEAPFRGLTVMPGRDPGWLGPIGCRPTTIADRRRIEAPFPRSAVHLRAVFGGCVAESLAPGY